MIKKPMLASPCTNVAGLSYPVLVTDKEDGIRCVTLPTPKDCMSQAVSRKFKPIPNRHIRTNIELHVPPWCDGEIIVVGKEFNETSGDVRREEGKPNFELLVFDYVKTNLSTPYESRMKDLQGLSLPSFCRKLIPKIAKSESDLLALEEDAVTRGKEGIMIRSLNGPYKCGRSTVNEGYLLKLKRFMDSEATIIGYKEQMRNDNVATKDVFGRTERSGHKENLTPKGVLGALVCRLSDGTEFDIGTGFNDADRVLYWQTREELVGRLVKFKHQPSGADKKPRFPVFLGFRDSWDM